MSNIILSAQLQYLINGSAEQFSESNKLHQNSNDWSSYISVGNATYYKFLTNGVIKWHTTSKLSDGNYEQILKIDDYKKMESPLLILFLLGYDEKTLMSFIEKFFELSNARVICNCPAHCLEENTLIDLVNGKTKTIKEMYNDHCNGIVNYVYSVDKNNNPTINKVNKVWKSGIANKLVKVTLDNDKYILTTPEHLYILRDGSSKPAKDLSINDSLMPIYFTYDKKGYKYAQMNTIIDCNKKSVHRIVAKKYYGDTEKTNVVHHIDFDKTNNNPENLKYMDKVEHLKYHVEHIEENRERINREKIINNLLTYNHKVKKVEVIQLDKFIDVYDMEVETDHNFYLNAGVVVHNSYQGSAYNLTELKSNYGDGEYRFPRIKDPEQKNLVCKHMWVVLQNFNEQIDTYIKNLLPYYKRYFGIQSPTGIERLRKELGEKGIRQMVATAIKDIKILKDTEMSNNFEKLTYNRLNDLFKNTKIENEEKEQPKPKEEQEDKTEIKEEQKKEEEPKEEVKEQQTDEQTNDNTNTE